MGTTAILKKDYEHYSLSLPVKCCRGKRLYRYVYGQLEKLHPCFSENFCFDTKLGFRRKKLCADVFVMDKRKLSEYKLKFPGSIFTAEENQKFKLFCDWQKLNRIMFCCLIFFSAVVSVGFFTRKKVARLANVSVNTEISKEAPEAILQDIGGFSEEPTQNDFLQQFFTMVATEKGKIQKLEWNLDMQSINLIISLSNIFPEIIEQYYPEAIIKSVSYREKVPFLTVSLIEKMDVPDQKSQNAQNYQVETIKKKQFQTWTAGLRNTVFENNGTMIDENPENASMSFKLPENRMDDFLQTVDLLWQETDSVIEKLSIQTESENFNVSVQAALRNHPYKENIFQVIRGNYMNLFDMEKKNTPPSESRNSVKPLNTENKQLSKQVSNQIGRITHADGSILSFYRGVDRKITVVRDEGN